MWSCVPILPWAMWAVKDGRLLCAQRVWLLAETDSKVTTDRTRDTGALWRQQVLPVDAMPAIGVCEWHVRYPDLNVMECGAGSLVTDNILVFGLDGESGDTGEVRTLTEIGAAKHSNFVVSGCRLLSWRTLRERGPFVQNLQMLVSHGCQNSRGIEEFLPAQITGLPCKILKTLSFG